MSDAWSRNLESTAPGFAPSLRDSRTFQLESPGKPGHDMKGTLLFSFYFNSCVFLLVGHVTWKLVTAGEKTMSLL